VRGRTFSGDTGARERGGALHRIGDMGFVVGAVEIDAVPASVHELVITMEATMNHLRRVQDIGSNASWTCSLREPFSIELGIRARSCVVSAEVWRVVAAEA
jgi:hypothetical protein